MFKTSYLISLTWHDQHCCVEALHCKNAQKHKIYFKYHCFWTYMYLNDSERISLKFTEIHWNSLKFRNSDLFSQIIVLSKNLMKTLILTSHQIKLDVIFVCSVLGRVINELCSELNKYAVSILIVQCAMCCVNLRVLQCAVFSLYCALYSLQCVLYSG